MTSAQIKPFYNKVAALCRMIKIEHSIFALPFAYAGAFLAAKGMPSWSSLFFLTLGMVAVRSFAMAFNRLVDLPFDQKNPRTAKRPLVTGEISLKQTWIFCAVTALIFIAACAGLNTLCLYLSVPALLIAAGYSYTKRFTWLCHFWLGTTLGLAPLAGWLSVTPSFALTPILFFFAVTFWVAGFDIFYSCQDVDFDKKQGLHSVPAHFGIDKALVIAAFSHVCTSIFLLLGGASGGLNAWWYILWALMSAVLLWEHTLVKAHDLSRVNTAFFTLNGLIAVVVLVAVLLGIYG